MRAEPYPRQQRSVWLHCPHCGTSKHLRRAEDLPTNVTCIRSPCPDCVPVADEALHEYVMEIEHGRSEHRAH